MIIVGLTGGIASGKTFVANYLKKLNIPVHESDLFVQTIYTKPTLEFLRYLKKNDFKNAILGKKVNKKIVRNEVFSDNKKRNVLEKYIHQKLKINRTLFLKKNKKQKIVFLDIPLLFENNLDKICDFVCSNIATLKVREERALKRSGMTKKIFLKIRQTQVKDAYRKEKSNYIINTSYSKEKTCLQVDKIIYDITKKKK